MTRYVYEPLFDSIRDWLNHGLTQHGHTLGEAVSYTIVELGMMPRDDEDPIWTTLNFTALSVVALENKVGGVPERELDQLDWFSEQVRLHCTNEAAVTAALENTKDREMFQSDFARVHTALKIK